MIPHGFFLMEKCPSFTLFFKLNYGGLMLYYFQIYNIMIQYLNLFPDDLYRKSS